MGIAPAEYWRGKRGLTMPGAEIRKRPFGTVRDADVECCAECGALHLKKKACDCQGQTRPNPVTVAAK
jgi:hypothetical protein